MSSFKFHLVTVVGIFLALALGIFIGSTFTEEGIILEQRGTIQRMRQDIDDLQLEKKAIQDEAKEMAGTMVVLQDWLGGVAEIYWQANPVEKNVWLIECGFDLSGPEEILSTRIVLENPDQEIFELLANSIVNGHHARLAWMDDGFRVEGNLTAPDYVLLAINPNQYAQELKALAEKLVNAGFPVIALGVEGWEGLAEMVGSPLYSSVSHLDTPLGLYCLGWIFQGKSGHYGRDNILPAGVWD